MSEEDKAEALRIRQANCEHSFIKSMADTAHRCVWCGMSRAEYEKATQ